MNLRNCAIVDKQHVQRDDAVLHVKIVLSIFFHIKHHRVCADILERLAHHAARNRARRTDCLYSKCMFAYF
jgi:hypothetical protein